MNSKVFFHIGFPKTATTYLQKEIFPYLKDICYIGRPYTQENQAFNQLQYADDSLFDSANFNNELQKINHQANNRNILFSDELFSGALNLNLINRSWIAQRISTSVPDAEIILFIRNHQDWIFSLYMQSLKIGWYANPLNSDFLHSAGDGFSLEKWLDDKRTWNAKHRHFNAQATLNMDYLKLSNICQLYNRYFNNVHIFLYEDLKYFPEKTIGKLADILGAERPIISKKTVNKSIQKQQVNYQMWFNKLPQNMPFKKVVAKSIIMFQANPVEDYKAFILNHLIINHIFEDNYNVNQQYNIGMEHYSNQYFNKNIE